MMRMKFAAAAMSALALGGVGIGVAQAVTPQQPSPPAVSQTQDPAGPGDVADSNQTADTANVQQGDQTGPETPDAGEQTGPDTDNVQQGDQSGPDTSAPQAAAPGATG